MVGSFKGGMCICQWVLSVGDMEGKLLKHRVNGFRLKLYFVRDLIPSVHAFVEHECST